MIKRETLLLFARGPVLIDEIILSLGENIDCQTMECILWLCVLIYYNHSRLIEHPKGYNFL